jgi:hypothetical protein
MPHGSAQTTTKKNPNVDTASTVLLIMLWSHKPLVAKNKIKDDII